jgi:hypothetical protein
MRQIGIACAHHQYSSRTGVRSVINQAGMSDGELRIPVQLVTLESHLKDSNENKSGLKVFQKR